LANEGECKYLNLKKGSLQRLQCKREGCIPIHRQQCNRARVHSFLPSQFLMSDCPASGHSGTGMKNRTDAGTNPVPE
jgi:hypothetical protein